MVYQLLNKDRVVAEFTLDSIEGFESINIINVDNTFYNPLLSDIQAFILNRKPPKHRKHIENILKQCGCDTLSGYLDVSHALSLNDTLWVKKASDKLDWSKVSLYTNPFNSAIAKAAFDGGLFGQQFSTTSPEFGTNGAFAKCWVRESGTIKLIKTGSDGYSNSGLEPYSEFYASQVLSALEVKHVNYGLTMRHGKLASKCDLFTSENIGLIPFAVINNKANIAQIVKWYKEQGLLNELAEMLVADALIFNQDRHLGNFGCLFDNENGKLLGTAPLYDHNISLFCYATDKDLLNSDTMKLYFNRVNFGPRLYDDFASAAKKLITPELRRKLINMHGFKLKKHPRYNLSDYRIDRLNKIIDMQIKNLLKCV